MKVTPMPASVHASKDEDGKPKIEVSTSYDSTLSGIDSTRYWFLRVPTTTTNWRSYSVLFFCLSTVRAGNCVAENVQSTHPHCSSWKRGRRKVNYDRKSRIVNLGRWARNGSIHNHEAQTWTRHRKDVYHWSELAWFGRSIPDCLGRLQGSRFEVQPTCVIDGFGRCKSKLMVPIIVQNNYVKNSRRK